MTPEPTLDLEALRRLRALADTTKVSAIAMTPPELDAILAALERAERVEAAAREVLEHRDLMDVSGTRNGPVWQALRAALATAPAIDEAVRRSLIVQMDPDFAENMARSGTLTEHQTAAELRAEVDFEPDSHS